LKGRDEKRHFRHHPNLGGIIDTRTVPSRWVPVVISRCRHVFRERSEREKRESARVGEGCVNGVWQLLGQIPFNGAVAIILAVFTWLLFRYSAILNGADKGDDDPNRRRYLEFKNRVASGDDWSRLYGRWVKRLLYVIDRFFGDLRQATPRCFRRSLGLGSLPTPLWTAASFDRCLLIALIYPIAAVFGIWLLTGRVGPVEKVLGLESDVAVWQRLLLLLLLSAICLGIKSIFTRRYDLYRVIYEYYKNISLVRFVVGFVAVAFFSAAAVVVSAVISIFVFYSAVAVAVAVAFAGDGDRTGGGAVAVVFAFALAVAIGLATLVADTVHVVHNVSSAFTGAFAFVVAFAFAFAVAVAVAVAFAVALRWMKGRGRMALFLFVYQTVMTAAVIYFTLLISHTPSARANLSFLLFCGLLTLVNAPFDWLSLGITRGLMRLGVRRVGWAPLWLGLLDVLLSTLIIIALTVTAVIAVQLFNRAAGTDVLDVLDLLNGISTEWWRPEYWWVYVMILSTQMPSLINLAIGATALFRSIPAFQRWCLARMPEDGPIADADKHLLATAFSLQIIGGVLFGTLAYLSLAALILGLFLPLMRVELITIADHVACWAMWSIACWAMP